MTVKDLQLRLIALGFNVGPAGADGKFGNDTLNAINLALDKFAPAIVQPKPAQMTTSAAGRAAISQREGNILSAYQDSVGVWTIGVGHTSAAGPPIVKPGLVISAARSDEILTQDLKKVEQEVLAVVKAQLTQNQFDALVSLDFNIGPGNFQKSTLVKKLNAGDIAGAADQFLVWNKAGGKVVDGLTTRRKAERKQFLTP